MSLHPIFPPQSEERKKELKEKYGLLPYIQEALPNYCDPDCTQYHVASGIIFSASWLMRIYATKRQLERALFTVNILAIPIFYLFAVHRKERRFDTIPKYRKTFEEHLEFYPITRRAWKQATISQRDYLTSLENELESEMTKYKQKFPGADLPI